MDQAACHDAPQSATIDDPPELVELHALLRAKGPQLDAGTLRSLKAIIVAATS